MLNKDSTKNLHTLTFLRGICLKAYHIPWSVNVEADKRSVTWVCPIPGLLLYFQKQSVDIFSLLTCNNRFVEVFQFSLGKYSQPSKSFVYMLHHFLIVFKEMSFIIANRHMLLIPRNVTAPNILPKVHFVH